MSAESAKVFTIPASAPFLRTLIGALLSGDLVKGFPGSRDPLALADATLYLPTRRACRLARDAFLEALNADAAILPRFIPIGDIDEDEIVFAHAAAGAEALEQQEALDGIERKILLAEMIRKWAARPEARTENGTPLVAGNPASILSLADDLARLFDDMTTRKVEWTKLKGLVPGDFDVYWQHTFDFLQTAQTEWPRLLEARGLIDPAARRDIMIGLEADRLTKHATGPVIAAGSTGSMPSTATLLATIARLPQGAVVLPGLDTDLDEPSWERIGKSDKKRMPVYGHPQFALHGLLQRIGIKRDAVTILGMRQPDGREALVSEALRPAEATDRWRERLSDETFGKAADAAMASVTVIEAAHAEDEALAIAIALREAVDDGSGESRTRNAALITPDRALARRVLAALARWNVPVDDSGGDALGDTRVGIFARLTADVVLGGVEPVPLLALLKHPLFHLGKRAGEWIPAIETLERALLRGPRPREGTAGLLQALSELRKQMPALHPADPRKALTESELSSAELLLNDLAEAIAPLEKLKAVTMPFAQIATLHGEVAAALSKRENGEAAAFSEIDGKALAGFFSSIGTANSENALPLKRSDYAEAFQASIGNEIVRRPARPESRMRILGPLEARLQNADRVVLGGLVEGIWPPDPRPDPWLSRPMRQELGLDLPERRIGLSAHDFAQALGAKEIVLSYAGKREGAPTVASRFLQRLAAVAGEERWTKAKERGNNYLAWGRSLDEPAADPKPCLRPEPKPPRDARPLSLSVTEIEHWLRDPYTIYAKHILKIRALDEIDIAPGASDRGTFIHKAIGDFSEKFASGTPADPLKELLAIGREAFAAVEAYPDARAFWWPRFERIARWFVKWEIERRANAGVVLIENSGAYEFPVGERMFRLRTRADRIEALNDGRYAVIDFKTGTPPTDKQVASGLAPQLTLEAAILRNGGFKGIPAGAPVAELTYVRLNGGDPAGERYKKQFKDSAPDQEADKALARLRSVAEKFENPDEPYRSFTRPEWVGRTYSDYDHLARVKEWSATGGESEGGGE